MKYIADLHIHSQYAYATSKNLNLENLYTWANIKGIHLVGTGDFTHPKWVEELQEKLIADGTGFFQFKHPPRLTQTRQSSDVHFCLTAEVCTIHKDGDKVRKNHSLIYAPDFTTVARINAKLSTIGNLAADGRPILGLSPRDLLEIILHISDRAYLIPAHVWTPWFSTLGSKSGYDSIDACFKDLTSHIFALETGLSSDPAMNRRLSTLDRYSMVSNSDAHSPQNLGREANLFDTDRTYDAMFESLKTKKGFLGTLEFFPQKGKYYLDGHRNCGICFEPSISFQYQNRCPVCGKQLTIGVLNRVESLADRKQSAQPEHIHESVYIIPLLEIIAEIMDKKVASHSVQKQYAHIIFLFGNELTFLRETPIKEIKMHLGPIYAEAIRHLRNQSITYNPGYDGLYGTIRSFRVKELKNQVSIKK